MNNIIKINKKTYFKIIIHKKFVIFYNLNKPFHSIQGNLKSSSLKSTNCVSFNNELEHGVQPEAENEKFQRL